MTCKHCGAQISIEDQYCPHCGTRNQEAAKHAADMQKYDREFKETKRQVLLRTGRLGKLTGKMIAVCLLVVCNLIVFAGHAFRYELEDMLTGMEVNARSKEHVENLESMEADREYLELGEYYQRNWLYYGEALKIYDYTASACQYYTRLYESLMSLVDKDAAVSYTTEDSNLETAADQITYLYETEAMLEEGSEWVLQRCPKEQQEVIYQIIDQSEVLLKSMLNLTEEEIAGLPEMEKTEILLLLGRKVGMYE